VGYIVLQVGVSGNTYEVSECLCYLELSWAQKIISDRQTIVKN